MVIFRDTTSLIIKRTLGDENHVRIGMFDIALWANGIRRTLRFVEKPPDEYVISDCSDLLDELENFEHSQTGG